MERWSPGGRPEHAEPVENTPLDRGRRQTNEGGYREYRRKEPRRLAACPPARWSLISARQASVFYAAAPSGSACRKRQRNPAVNPLVDDLEAAAHEHRARVVGPVFVGALRPDRLAFR